jgi:pilus assembly protein CpaE
VIIDASKKRHDWSSPGDTSEEGVPSLGSGINEEVVTSPGTAEELAFRVKAQMLRMGYAIPRNAESSGQTSGTRGSVTAVFSLKGGVGKSTIAVNLAVGLATESKARVLIIDADLVAGDVGVLLDLKGQYTLRDVCVRQVHDQDSLARMVVTHSSGVSALLRPTNLNELTNLDTSGIPDILPVVRQMYDHIIVNMSPSIEEMNARLLDGADRILVVMTPEMPSIHATQRFLELAGTIGYAAKAKLVVNRDSTGIDVTSLQHSFKVPIAARIVSDGRQVVRAANEGTSLFVLDPHKKQEITRNFAQLVNSVLGRKAQPVPTRMRPRFLPRWLAA